MGRAQRSPAHQPITRQKKVKSLLRQVDASGMFGLPGSAQLSYERLCDEDRQLVEALESCGASLDEERHVLHYIEVETEQLAERVATLGNQWMASISPPTLDDETWFVVFERDDRVLTPENVLADRHLFETMASVYDGYYEGWEACV